jgi:hypothetical protein
MALSVIAVTSVSPRGGTTGTTVTVQGSGFGVIVGTVRLDPLVTNVAATVVSWVDDEVVFTVPTMAFADRFVDVLIERVDLSDGHDFPFWLRTVGLAPVIPNLDYAWPALEAGPNQNTDDPRTWTAADFNRVLARLLGLGAGGVLPPLAGLLGAVLLEDPIGSLQFRCLTPDDICPAFAVGLTLFGGSNPVEVGESVISPLFNAMYSNGTPTFAELTDNDGNPAQNVLALPNPITRPHTYVETANNASVVFTLTANTGGPNKLSTVPLVWSPRVYWGTGVAGGSTEAFIEALANNSLASSRARTFTVTPGATEKIYYAYPASYGAGTFVIGGFEGGFLPSTTISVTNAFGVTQSYLLYESTLVGLGTTTVQVS